MGENKEIENFTGYQREAAKMSAFTSTVKQPASGQVTEEQMRTYLDACDHSKSSYTEEATAEELRKFRKQYEADKIESAKENKVNRWIAVVSMLVAVGSLIVSLVK